MVSLEPHAQAFCTESRAATVTKPGGPPPSSRAIIYYPDLRSQYFWSHVRGTLLRPLCRTGLWYQRVPPVCPGACARACSRSPFVLLSAFSLPFSLLPPSLPPARPPALLHPRPPASLAPFHPFPVYLPFPPNAQTIYPFACHLQSGAQSLSLTSLHGLR